MTVITLVNTPTGWVAQHCGGELTQEVVRLFGTDTLPTPFTALASYARVKAELQRLNPDCVVQ